MVKLVKRHGEERYELRILNPSLFLTLFLKAIQELEQAGLLLLPLIVVQHLIMLFFEIIGLKQVKTPPAV